MRLQKIGGAPVLSNQSGSQSHIGVNSTYSASKAQLQAIDSKDGLGSIVSGHKET